MVRCDAAAQCDLWVAYFYFSVSSIHACCVQRLQWPRFDFSINTWMQHALLPVSAISETKSNGVYSLHIFISNVYSLRSLLQRPMIEWNTNGIFWHRQNNIIKCERRRMVCSCRAWKFGRILFAPANGIHSDIYSTKSNTNRKHFGYSGGSRASENAATSRDHVIKLSHFIRILQIGLPQLRPIQFIFIQK